MKLRMAVATTPDELAGERRPTLKDRLLTQKPRVEGGVELPDRKKMRLGVRELDLEDRDEGEL